MELGLGVGSGLGLGWDWVHSSAAATRRIGLARGAPERTPGAAASYTSALAARLAAVAPLVL